MNRHFLTYFWVSVACACNPADFGASTGLSGGSARGTRPSPGPALPPGSPGGSNNSESSGPGSQASGPNGPMASGIPGNNGHLGNTGPNMGQGTLNGPGAVSIEGGQVCIRGPVDVNVIVALDTTGSMSDQNRALASGVPVLLNELNTLKTRIGDKIKDFRLGFISYIDQERRGDDGRNGAPIIVPPTTDLASALAVINANAQSGHDHSDTSEGGIWAITKGLELAKRSAVPGRGAITIEILATDAWSHDGTGHSSDCMAFPNDCHDNGRTSSTLAAEQFLADPYFKSWFLFDWSPSRAGVDGDDDFVDGTVGRFGSPMGQWQALRTRWQQLQHVTLDVAGAHLGESISNGTQGMSQLAAILGSKLVACP